MPAPAPLLAIDGLTVEFRTAERSVTAVRDLSLTIGHGETVAVVGESGSGKSVTALAVMGLLPRERDRKSTRLNSSH